ncbi:hypothetical protein [Vibrio sp. VB16]|nr:hypothetical protein [Vibrio sp. VB16]
MMNEGLAGTWVNSSGSIFMDGRTNVTARQLHANQIGKHDIKKER